MRCRPTIKQPADPSLPPECNIDIVMQQRVCAVVNTCEYCHQTTGQLEESIIKSLDGDQYKKQVDLSFAPLRDPLAPNPKTGKVVAPHGLVGQSFDGDDIAVDGKKSRFAPACPPLISNIF